MLRYSQWVGTRPYPILPFDFDEDSAYLACIKNEIASTGVFRSGCDAADEPNDPFPGRGAMGHGISLRLLTERKTSEKAYWAKRLSADEEAKQAEAAERQRKRQAQADAEWDAAEKQRRVAGSQLQALRSGKPEMQYEPDWQAAAKERLRQTLQKWGHHEAAKAIE